MAAQARTRQRSGAEQQHGTWLMLAVLLVGQLMCIIDVFVVNVAMPLIGTRLHASGASLQLIVGGYTIGYAMLLITGARLGDRYGRRRMYLTGVTVFTAASLACALAPRSARPTWRCGTGPHPSRCPRRQSPWRPCPSSACSPPSEWPVPLASRWRSPIPAWGPGTRQDRSGWRGCTPTSPTTPGSRPSAGQTATRPG